MSSQTDTQISEQVEFDVEDCEQCRFTAVNRCVLNDLGRTMRCARIQVTPRERASAAWDIMENIENIHERVRKLRRFHDQQWRDKLGDFESQRAQNESVYRWCKKRDIRNPSSVSRHIQDDKVPCPRCIGTGENQFHDEACHLPTDSWKVKDILGPSKMALRSVLLSDHNGDNYEQYVNDLEEELGVHFEQYKEFLLRDDIVA